MSYWEDELDETMNLANNEGNDIDYPSIDPGRTYDYTSLDYDRRSGDERRKWNYYCDRCERYLSNKYCDKCDKLAVRWTSQMKDYRITSDRRDHE